MRGVLPARFIVALLSGATLAVAPVAPAQEADHAEGEAPEEHSADIGFRHVVSFSGGLATHTDRWQTGGALGISYAYRLSHRWAVGAKLEYVTSSAERDIVGLAGIAFEPVARLELGAAAGVERAEKEVSHHGEFEEEQESEAVFRLGVAYGFHLRDGVSLAPEFNVDMSSSRVTLVYGLVFSVGL
jgi:hypothetical protein